MTLVIRTWLDKRNTTERAGSPCRFANSGYESVEHLRKELKRRWSENYFVTDIPNGVEIAPKPSFERFCYHGKQLITLEND